MRSLLLALAAAATLWMPLSGRDADADLDAAALAWDRGDYVSALTTYLRILDSPEWEAAFETIALQTGELFETIELTTDGDAPRFAPGGRHFSYETGTLLDRRTRIATPSKPLQPIAELQGFRGVFSPDGSRFAYLEVTPTPSLEQLSAAVDEGPPLGRPARLNAFNAAIAIDSALVIRDLTSGQETRLDTGRRRKTGLAFTADGVVFAGADEASPAQLYAARPDAAPIALTTGEGEKVLGEVGGGGRALTFTTRGPGGRGGGPTPAEPAATPAGAPGGGALAGGRGGAPARFGLLTFPGGRLTTLAGSAPALSDDGTALAYVAREGSEYRLMMAPLEDPQQGTAVHRGPERIEAPAFSSDGRRLVYQMMPREDWEIYTIARDGGPPTRLTREIQHDVLPRFLAPDRVLAMIGEARHRRSYLYDVASGTRTRLFHNNTVRTIAPEYAWVPSAVGTHVLIVAERDGDTVSPERGVYLVDLTRSISRDALRARIRMNLNAEQALRARVERMYAPIAGDVRDVVAQASIARVFAYQKALFDFDSKHITQPGNRKAAQYLFDTYRSFGYEPAFQEFEASQRGQAPIRTANVLATLRGTLNPELVYVVSSHYDSVAIGPGADDDSSGTAALLETARLLAGRPQPATIVFASFTGEEAGLLGSREYVRQAVANDVRIVGALNNDMIGWANDHRLDNTIRYSNVGIRDVQHGAAMQFTNLITYDALYYKSTDAAAYYEAYGDIVGGIGSYPVLGNPHYHQSHDVLETINHQLVMEVARTTAATLMLLASSPSRLTELRVNSFSGGTARLTWRASPEKAVTRYIVAHGPPANPEAQRVRVTQPAVTLTNIAPGTVIAVKAVNARGLEGWDWARVTIP